MRIILFVLLLTSISSKAQTLDKNRMREYAKKTLNEFFSEAEGIYQNAYTVDDDLNVDLELKYSLTYNELIYSIGMPILEEGVKEKIYHQLESLAKTNLPSYAMLGEYNSIVYKVTCKTGDLKSIKFKYYIPAYKYFLMSNNMNKDEFYSEIVKL
jgi:hypothetical protein